MLVPNLVNIGHSEIAAVVRESPCELQGLTGPLAPKSSEGQERVSRAKKRAKSQKRNKQSQDEPFLTLCFATFSNFLDLPALETLVWLLQRARMTPVSPEPGGGRGFSTLLLGN